MDKNKSNKNTIKEMLEGHKKGVNFVAVIIGIVVVLILGIAAVYMFSTLKSKPQNYAKEDFSKYMENKNYNAAQNIEENRQPKNTQTNQSIYENTDNMQGENQIKTYELPEAKDNATSANSSKATEVTEPQIINPYAEKSAEKHKSIKASQPKHTKYKKHAAIKKHKVVIAHKHNYTGKKYMLQVTSNLNKKFAAATVSKLKSCGHDAYSRVKIINNKIFTRVMVGPINGYSAAKEEALLIKKQLHLKYMPTIKRYAKVP